MIKYRILNKKITNNQKRLLFINIYVSDKLCKETDKLFFNPLYYSALLNLVFNEGPNLYIDLRQKMPYEDLNFSIKITLFF